MLRQARGGVACDPKVGVGDQRQDRVRERRGGHLDAALLPQAGVQRDHLPEDAPVLGQHHLLVRLDVAASALHQHRQGRGSQEVGVGPGEVEQHLEVAEVLLRPRLQRRVDAAAGAVVGQLPVAGEAGDRPGIDVEETLQQEAPVVRGQPPGGDLRSHPVAVLGPRGKVFELQQQGRREVEHRPHAGVLGHQRRHVVIILGRVHPHPRPGIHAGPVLGMEGLGVERLMLMPHEHQVEAGIVRLKLGLGGGRQHRQPASSAAASARRVIRARWPRPGQPHAGARQRQCRGPRAGAPARCPAPPRRPCGRG